MRMRIPIPMRVREKGEVSRRAIHQGPPGEWRGGRNGPVGPSFSGAPSHALECVAVVAGFVPSPRRVSGIAWFVVRVAIADEANATCPIREPRWMNLDGQTRSRSKGAVAPGRECAPASTTHVAPT